MRLSVAGTVGNPARPRHFHRLILDEDSIVVAPRARIGGAHGSGAEDDGGSAGRNARGGSSGSAIGKANDIGLTTAVGKELRDRVAKQGALIKPTEGALEVGKTQHKLWRSGPLASPPDEGGDRRGDTGYGVHRTGGFLNLNSRVTDGNWHSTHPFRIDNL